MAYIVEQIKFKKYKKGSFKNENSDLDFNEKELDKADNFYNSRIGIFYSHIIYISGGAIVFSTTIYGFIERKILNPDLLKWSWILFLCAIIFGIFLFPITAKKYHRCAHARYDKRLNESDKRKFDCECCIFKILHSVFLPICLLSFFGGLILLIRFSSINLF